MKNNNLTRIFTRTLTATAVAATALGSLNIQASEYKHVAVAPEHMQAQKMASAQSKGLFSHSTMLPIYSNTLKAAGKNGKIMEQQVFLDGAVDSPIVLLTPDADKWFLSVTGPDGKNVFDELNNSKTLDVTDVQVGPQSFKGKQLLLPKAKAGQWTIKLTHKDSGLSAKTFKKDIAAYLIFKGDSELQAFSYLDNNFTTQHNDINIVTQVIDATNHRGDRKQMVKKSPLMGSIDSAIATVKTPSGKSLQIVLNDKGINGDKVAGDGRYSAKAPTSEVGVYANQVQIKGRHANGKRFSRTTTDIYPVAAVSYALTDSAAQLKQTGETSALLSVPVKNLSPNLEESGEVHMSAEIWGTGANGEPKSAAWVGGIVTPKSGNADTMLELSFDTRWLSRQNLQGPYTLKSVRLQTVDGNVPLAQKDQLSVRALSPITPSKKSQSLIERMAITPDMLMGKAPQKAKAKSQDSVASTGGPALMLVHGYCSSQAWNTNHFYNSVEFKDYKQSVSHSEFANRVKNFGAAYSSYGIVAHSQGGAAALELYAKHWSGLDNASSGNLIQSVGTPYQGTALAGNLAALGEVFGAGCGYNTDLTYNGASNWLSTIPSWARAKVNYYTTSFDTAWWRYDYCHLATDLFLDDPEDGTTEKWSGQLSGAVNKGHKTGQCHTGGMRDMAQTQDTGRNSSMSSAAAR